MLLEGAIQISKNVYVHFAHRKIKLHLFVLYWIATACSIRVCAAIGCPVSILNRLRQNSVPFSLYVSFCMCSLFMDVF